MYWFDSIELWLHYVLNELDTVISYLFLIESSVNNNLVNYLILKYPCWIDSWNEETYLKFDILHRYSCI